MDLQVRAAGPGPSLLMLATTWDDRWTVSIDGVMTPLLRTDVSLGAVLVPPGDHRVELDYHDPWITLGAMVGSLALSMLAFGCALWCRLTSRRAARTRRCATGT
jgi:hypothetical protein